MYSVLDPVISPSSVNGERPAKIKTGARPVAALCTAAPSPDVPTSTCTMTHCGSLVMRAYPSAMDSATISFGQVMILGKALGFSFRPLDMASMMLGWSEPRFTKQYFTPRSQRASKKA